MKDDSIEELPQRTLPRFSIRWIIGLVTVAAVFFTICQLAASGTHWAQITVLIVGINLVTFLAYAAFFFIGMAWDTFLVDRRVAKNAMVPTNRPLNSNDTPGTSTRVAWIVASLIASSGAVASADVNWVGNYPQGANGLDYRLQVGLDKHSGQGGYNHLHLQFKPTRGAFAADHDLTVTVSSHSDYRTQLSAVTSQSFSLNQSSQGSTEHLLIPHFGAATTLRLWITENGKLVHRRKLSIQMGTNQYGYSDQRWTIGIIDRGINAPPFPAPPFPDTRALTAVLGNGTTTLAPIPEDSEKLRLTSKESRTLAQQTQNTYLQFRVMSQPDLTKQWLAYSDLDLIMLNAATWTDLIEDQPEEAAALQQFVAAGGALLMYGNDSTIPTAKQSINAGAFEKLPSSSVPIPNRVTARLELTEFNDTSPLTNTPWNGGFIKMSQQSGNSQFQHRQDVYDELAKSGSEMTTTMPAAKLATKIETADFGLGKIVLIHDEDPFPGSFQFWMALESELTQIAGVASWVERHGIEYKVGNTNYWRWLIESVGGPPVKSFLTLNTLFVLIVGPIAYFVLRKLDRLYLLYFAAPAFAVLFTGGLFSFAIFSDGVGTKLRTHQWTWVDSANQAVVHQDRSTIYSSFGTDSLRFDRQSLVLAVLPSGVEDFSSRTGTSAPPTGRVRWTDDAQIWSGEFLPTRSQVQYQVLRPELGAALPLTFQKNSEEEGFTVHNHSEQTIGPLFYCDSRSVCHSIDSLEAGQSAVMQVSSQQAVGDLIGEDELPPVGIVPNVRSSWSMIYNSDTPGDDRPMPERLLSRWLRRLPKDSFLGLSEVDRSRFPVDDPQISLATHVIMGRTH